MDRGGKTQTVSADRLKVAYTDPQTERPSQRQQPSQKNLVTQTPPPPKQPTITRSGRQVKPNKRYISVLRKSSVAESTPQEH